MLVSSTSVFNIYSFWQIIGIIYSVKPFKSKNRDKIYLEASNPNHNPKKVLIEILERHSNQ